MLHVYSLTTTGDRTTLTPHGFESYRNAQLFARTIADSMARVRRAARELGTPDRYADVTAITIPALNASYPIHPVAFPELHGGAPVRPIGYKGTHRH